MFLMGGLSLSLRVCVFLLASFAAAGFQLDQKRVEALEVGFPKTAVLFQPKFEFLKRGGTQGVNAALGVHANVNETGGVENAEVLGDLGLAETEAADQVANGAGAVAQEFDDVEAVGLGEGAERGDHGGIEYA
jgi:hypothetical protein